jgi:phospholipase/carboxylesterase
MKTETWGGLQTRIVGGTDGKGGGDGPVVVLLHGFGAPGTDLIGLWKMINAPQNTRFVFPEAPIQLPPQYAGGRAWWMIDLMRFEQNLRTGRSKELTKEIPDGLTDAREKVVALLDAIEANLGTNKLFLGGFSQGAMLSCDVVLRTARTFAGLIMLSGTIIAADEWLSMVHQRKGLRVFMSHGTHDPLLPFAFSEELRQHFTRAGLEVTWQSFTGGHEIPMPVLSSLSNFLQHNGS